LDVRPGAEEGFTRRPWMLESAPLKESTCRPTILSARNRVSLRPLRRRVSAVRAQAPPIPTHSLTRSVEYIGAFPRSSRSTPAAAQSRFAWRVDPAAARAQPAVLIALRHVGPRYHRARHLESAASPSSAAWRSSEARMAASRASGIARQMDSPREPDAGAGPLACFKGELPVGVARGIRSRGCSRSGTRR